MTSMITYKGPLDMQVCVPKDWTDEQVLSFAELENPAGTSNGWFIRKQDDPALNGDNERVQCSQISDNCHIMLDV